MNFEQTFYKLVDMMAPPLPEEVGGIEVRKKILDVLSPMLFNKWFPPAPKGLVTSVKSIKSGRNGW